MTVLIKLIIALVVIGILPADLTTDRTADQRKEVLAVIDMLIDGWRQADFKKVDSALHPSCRFVTLRSANEMQVGTREHLLETVKTLKPGNWDDRLRDQEVRIDPSGIATVWARYEFYSHGKRSHCGVESFQLYQMAEGWKIVNFADTHSAGFCK